MIEKWQLWANYYHCFFISLLVAACQPVNIPMSSEYDYFGDWSRVDLEAQLIESGEINQRELKNRQLLREIMT